MTAFFVSIGAKLLLGGRWAVQLAARVFDWLLEKPIRGVLLLFAVYVAAHAFVIDPHLREARDTAIAQRDTAVRERDAEKLAHQRTKDQYRAAQTAAAAADAARVKRVAAEQQEITDEVVADYQGRLADARARAEQLRRTIAQAGRRPAGAPSGEPVPVAGDAAGRAPQASGDPGLPATGRTAAEQLERDLVATEQALQLDALIDFVERQATVSFDAESRPEPRK